jgi:hypothetical protein
MAKKKRNKPRGRGGGGGGGGPRGGRARGARGGGGAAASERGSTAARGYESTAASAERAAAAACSGNYTFAKSKAVRAWVEAECSSTRKPAAAGSPCPASLCSGFSWQVERCAAPSPRRTPPEWAPAATAATQSVDFHLHTELAQAKAEEEGVVVVESGQRGGGVQDGGVDPALPAPAEPPRPSSAGALVQAALASSAAEGAGTAALRSVLACQSQRTTHELFLELCECRAGL